MSASDSDKTVFISYRRDVSAFVARAVFMDLRANNYDVFMDIESIDSGAFESVIMHQIAARSHFVLILTPGSIERCVEEHDWLRREIETAMDLGRNIVPILVNNFSFKDSELYLTGKLEALSRYNALNVPYDYFDEAMSRLRTRFLKQPVRGEIKPTPVDEQESVTRKVAQAAEQPAPTLKQLSAEGHVQEALERLKAKDFNSAIANLNEAIRLNPDFKEAYYHRARAKRKQDNLDGAIADYDACIQLDSQYMWAFFDRAFTYMESNNPAAAIADYSEVIRLRPNEDVAYNNRGEAYFALGSYQLALSDFEKANLIKHSGFHMAIAGSAVTHHALGDVEKAKKLWKSLLIRSKNYRDIAWVEKELNWSAPMTEEARKLIAKL